MDSQNETAQLRYLEETSIRLRRMDFEWLYRFCFPQQSALHRSLEALMLLAFLIFPRFY